MKLIETEQILKKLEIEEFPQPEIVPLRHPVLLCHGYGGLSTVILPSPMHEVCMLLRGHGILAFAPNIVPYATIETRAAEWDRKIGLLCERHGIERFNVIAHSMSGLDIRHMLLHGENRTRVASLTTLATPHRGTSLAELVLKTPEQVRDLLGEVFNWLGNNVYPKSKSDAVGAVRQLTRDYVNGTFNPATEVPDGLACFSYSAAVGKGTGEPLNPIYRYQNHHIYREEGINDSFVSSESARFGEHIETVPLSHLEQIGLSLSRDRKRMFEEFWHRAARRLFEEGF